MLFRSPNVTGATAGSQEYTVSVSLSGGSGRASIASPTMSLIHISLADACVDHIRLDGQPAGGDDRHAADGLS